MKNWKTTLAGALTALGLTLSANSDNTLHLIGQVATAVGALLLGLSAKDNNVTGGTKQQ